ncbi:unnamed protein product [Closterium sp. NIES-54]
MLLAPEGDPDALDIPTPRSYAEAIEDEVPPPGANIVSGMWILRVKQPPGSPPAFKARYVARGFIYAGQDFCHPPAGRSTQHSHMEGSHQTTAGDGRADGLPRWHRGDAVGKLLQPACRVFVVQLLTFTAISRCCSPGVRIALKPCRDYLDAGLQAWHFIESTYQVADDLYIGQLEEHMTYLRMGDQETATDYYNWALRLLATMRMSGVQYSTASYVTHVLKGLPSNYNVMKRLSVVPSTQATLNEDSLTSYILWDEAMQEAKHEPDDNEAKGGRGRSASRRPCRGNWPRKEKQSNKSTSAKDADSLTGGKGRDNKEASCSLVGVVEPTISLAPEAGEDFQAMAAAVQSNRAVVLLDSGCSHHLMGTKEVFVDLQPSGNVKHVRGFNGVLQDVQGRGTVALQGEGGKQVLILDVLYVSGVHVNLLLAGQLKENGVKLKEDGDRILFVTSAGDILGRASYTGRVLCTDVRPCSAKSALPKTEVVALQAIVSATKSTSDRLHARLAHVSMDTIQSLAKHEVATGLELKSASGADSPCVSCVGGKLVRHTLDVPVVEAKPVAAEAARSCVQPRVAADFRVWGSLAHFRARGAKKLSPRTRDCIFLGFPLDASGWVFYDSVTYQIFASQDVTFDESVYYYRRRPHRAPLPFASCLVRCVARRSAVVPPPQHPVPVVSGGAGGAVAEGEGTGAAGADGVGSGFAGVVGVEFPPCSSLRPVAAEPGGVSVGGTGGPKGVSGVGAGSGGARAGGTGTVAPALCSELPWLSFLLTDLGERPRSPPVSFADNTSAVLLCEEPRLRGGKPKPKDRWGLHLSVSEESKGWELLDIADNWVVTTSNVVFYKTMSLEVWKAEQGPALGRTQVDQPTDTLTATLPLLAEVGAIADADAEGVHHPSVAPPFVADLRGLTPVSASSDEGRSGVSPVVPAKSIAGGRRDAVKIGVGTKLMPTREQQAEEVQPTLVKPAGLQSTREQAAVKPTKEQSATGQSVGELTTGEKSAGTQTDVQWNDEGSEAGFFFGNASYTITAHTSINSRNCS